MVGTHAGSGTGVYGTAPSGTGINGYSASGTGVSGASSTGTGMSGSSGTGKVAVQGTITSATPAADSTAVYAQNNDTGTSGAGVYGAQNGSGYGVWGATPSGWGVYGVSSSGIGLLGNTFTASGNWAIYGYGNIGASGTKSAVVPAQDGKGHLTLYCLESPECWFEDFGAARLSGGSAAVRIDPVFAQTIHTADYHVFVQAEGQCQGLIVRDKTGTGFTVQEADGGTSDVPFAYRIVGRRRDVTAPCPPGPGRTTCRTPSTTTPAS